jgi:hypothetical protein
MLESGTVNSDGGQAAALFFSHRAHREHREKIFSKLKAIILFFVPLFSVLSLPSGILRSKPRIYAGIPPGSLLLSPASRLPIL